MSPTRRRTAPLAAPPRAAGAAPESAGPDEPTGPTSPHERLAAEVRTLRTRRGALHLDERLLMVAGGVIAPLGLVVVLLGWWGAARTPHVFEQVPYLISGGLFGLSLVVLGAFCYFTHWLTQLIKEQRAQSQAVLGALEQLAARVASADPRARSAIGSNGAGASTASTLVATERGTMAHRPSCQVVAGRSGLRPVRAGDGLPPCRLCDPYGPPQP